MSTAKLAKRFVLVRDRKAQMQLKVSKQGAEIDVDTSALQRGSRGRDALTEG